MHGCGLGEGLLRTLQVTPPVTQRSRAWVLDPGSGVSRYPHPHFIAVEFTAAKAWKRLKSPGLSAVERDAGFRRKETPTPAPRMSLGDRMLWRGRRQVPRGRKWAVGWGPGSASRLGGVSNEAADILGTEGGNGRPTVGRYFLPLSHTPTNGYDGPCHATYLPQLQERREVPDPLDSAVEVAGSRAL